MLHYTQQETSWVPVTGENYLYIYCLWVDGKYKGKGYAKALMEYCLNYAKELPCVFNNWALFYNGKFITFNLPGIEQIK